MAKDTHPTPSAKDQHHIPLPFDEAVRRCIKPVTLVPPVVQVLHGDCLTLLPRIEDQSIHLVITDPPYFLDGLDPLWKKGKADKTRRSGAIGGLPVGMKFDPRQGIALQKFITRVGQQMLRVMMPGAFAILFSQPRLSHRMAVGLEDLGFEIRDMYGWHFEQRAQSKAFSMNHFVDRRDDELRKKRELKRQLRGRKTAQLRPQFEMMILAQKPCEGTLVENWMKYRTGLMDGTIKFAGKTPSTLMLAEKPRKESYNEHLTVKPLKLIRHLITLFSEPGQKILDPFLGSGTTAVAALQERRSCTGMEINPDYVAIAERRLEESSP